MAKASGPANGVARISGPGGAQFYQVGGSSGRIFSTQRAANSFARAKRTIVTSTTRLTTTRSGRPASRRDLEAFNEAQRQANLRI